MNFKKRRHLPQRLYRSKRLSESKKEVIDFIESQLRLLQSIGLQNYGQLQAAPADAAEDKD